MLGGDTAKPILGAIVSVTAIATAGFDRTVDLNLNRAMIDTRCQPARNRGNCQHDWQSLGLCGGSEPRRVRRHIHDLGRNWRGEMRVAIAKDDLRLGRSHAGKLKKIYRSGNGESGQPFQCEIHGHLE